MSINTFNLKSYLIERGQKSVSLYFSGDDFSHFFIEVIKSEKVTLQTVIINKDERGRYVLDPDHGLNENQISKLNQFASFLFPDNSPPKKMETAAAKRLKTDLSSVEFLSEVNSVFSQKEPVTEEDIKKLCNDKRLSECDQDDELVQILKDLKQILEYKGQGGNWKTSVKGGHMNDVFFLKNAERERLFVLKPNPITSEKKQVIDNAKREHVAHLLNFHKLFPIPFTAYVKIDGEVCSIQRFIKGKSVFKLNEGSVWSADSASSSSDEEHESIEEICRKIDVGKLWALLVFDLLFLNPDRNEENCLFEDQNNLYIPKGVDHEKILPETGVQGFMEKLNIMLYAYCEQILSSKQIGFLNSNLFNSTNLKKYEAIISLHMGKISGHPEWMSFISKCLTIIENSRCIGLYDFFKCIKETKQDNMLCSDSEEFVSSCMKTIH